MLRDANEVDYERNQTSVPHKRQIDNDVEDDVEFPNFSNKDEIMYTSANASACNLDEEIDPKNKVTGNCCFTSEANNYQKMKVFSSGGNRRGVCTWLAENAEEDALSNVNDYSNSTSFHSSSSKLKWSSRGSQGKAKHKFSIRTRSRTENLYKDSSDVYNSHLSTKGKEMDGMMKDVMPAGYSDSHTHSTTSMAELLFQVQDEHDLQEGGTTNVAPGHSDIDDDPDCLGSDSSEDTEIQELIMPVFKQKTIADQFHEALGAASTNENGPMYAVPQHTGFGLFGKLQRVLQSEKEKDSYFINKLQKEDKSYCLDVKILSKTLEGQLTVCLCSFIENDENSRSTDNPQNFINRKNMTIIFSSRICSDVELDVGTLVRVHPPWKEVKLKGNDKSVILSTYYSQI